MNLKKKKKFLFKLKYHKVHEQIIAERNSCSEKERKTRYADPSY